MCGLLNAAQFSELHKSLGVKNRKARTIIQSVLNFCSIIAYTGTLANLSAPQGKALNNDLGLGELRQKEQDLQRTLQRRLRAAMSLPLGMASWETVAQSKRGSGDSELHPSPAFSSHSPHVLFLLVTRSPAPSQ